MDLTGTAFEQPSAISTFTCPRCSTPMRLSLVLPGRTRSRQTLVFECKCGFEYRQSERIARALPTVGA
jgi:RNase P subunit RPR2